MLEGKNKYTVIKHNGKILKFKVSKEFLNKPILLTGNVMIKFMTNDDGVWKYLSLDDKLKDNDINTIYDLVGYFIKEQTSDKLKVKVVNIGEQDAT